MMPLSSVAVGNKTLPAEKFWPRRLLFRLLPLLVAYQMFLAIIFVPLALRGVDDFRQLYTGGYMVRTGHAAELYDYDAQQHFEELLIPVGRHFMLPIDHLAFEELFFVPLSLLTYRAAYWVFMAFNGALLILCARLLGRRFKLQPHQPKWVPAFLLLAFFPIPRAMEKGQDSVIMLTLLAAALWAVDHEKEFVAGLLVGVGIFKFQIAIPIALLFLLWRRWRFFAGFSASAVVACLVSLWLVGLDGAREYAHMLLSMSVRLTSDLDMLRYGTHPRDMMNLRGLLSAIFGGRLPHGYVQFLIAACSVVVLLAAARQRPSLSLAIAAASLVSYHFIVHDASILIIVIAGAFCSRLVWDGAVAILLLIAPLCGMIPDQGYLAAIPLLGLFLLMLGHAHGSGESAEKG
jgi:Glycosyltransferase family 87